MAAIPSTRFVTASFAQLKSSIHLTLRKSSSSSSTCFRFRVRVRDSPDFISGVSMSSSAAESIAAPLPAEDVVVQYVVLRRDLIDTWPLGSVVTQGCHASVAAIWSHKEDPHTVDYCSPANIDSMHKVTLEVKGETQLSNLSEKLTAGGIAHKLWIEQPENIPTCLATKPYPKSVDRELMTTSFLSVNLYPAKVCPEIPRSLTYARKALLGAGRCLHSLV